VNEPLNSVNEPQSFVNEPLNSVNEPQSFVDESLNSVDKPRSFVDESLNSINEVKWAVVIQYDPKDAINRRLYKGLILVKTALSRVSCLNRTVLGGYSQGKIRLESSCSEKQVGRLAQEKLLVQQEFLLTVCLPSQTKPLREYC
jgi:hypothetical protein